LACGNQRRLTGSGSALEALRDDALHKSTYFTLILIITTITNLYSVFRSEDTEALEITKGQGRLLHINDGAMHHGKSRGSVFADT